MDAQLTAASQPLASFVARADERGFTVTPALIATHVEPGLYVEIIDPPPAPW